MSGKTAKVPKGKNVASAPLHGNMAMIPAALTAGVMGLTSLLGNNSNSTADMNRLDTRIDSLQRQQEGFNYSMAGLVSGHGQQLQNLATRHTELASRTQTLSDQYGETSLQLGRVQGDANSLQSNQNRIDSQLRQFQGDQHNLNLAVTERTARMEEQYRMKSEQQESLNDDFLARAVALQEKLGSTATQMEVVRARADHLDNGLNELTLSHRQTNQRFDQMQTINNQQIQLLATNAARLDERYSNHTESQKLVNENFLKCTDALTEKQIVSEKKLELISHRADTLQDGQTKIDFELRLQRQIAEDRQRELTRYNQDLVERNVRVEEKQNCFITEQKSQNDQFVNRTENVIEKLGENAKQIDLITFRIDNLHAAQQKAELEQKDKEKQCLETAKKVDVVENGTQNLRDDQREIKELLQKLVAQVSAIDARTRTMEGRLETLQSDYTRVNEMCIKFEAKFNLLGKFSEEQKKTSD